MPELKQGDVRIGDLVRLMLDDGAVEGRVTETASDGGVIGITVGGVYFAAGLPYVRLIEAVTKPGDLAIVKFVAEVARVEPEGVYVWQEKYPGNDRYFLNEHVTITRNRAELEAAVRDA